LKVVVDYDLLEGGGKSQGGGLLPLMEQREKDVTIP